MFAARVSTKRLALLCRSLGISLDAGVPILKALDTATRKYSDAHLRRVMLSVIDDIKSGSTFTDAVESHGHYFPELFVDMTAVAEQTGKLPEVLLALAEHYENNLRLKKEFVQQITWPLLQLMAAIGIIALLIYILGWIGENTGTPLDILGWGLMGTSGAITWLLGWVVLAFLIWFLYRMALASHVWRKSIHRVLMAIPVVGRCLRDFAIARFSWAFYLTQSAGMPVDDSLDASLRATSNGAFDSASRQIIDDVLEGEQLGEALDRSHLFPEDFLDIVHVSEMSGTVPESLHRLSPEFEAQARRSLAALTVAAGWGIWGMVAAFVIFLIFKLAMWYIGMINSVAGNPLGG